MASLNHPNIATIYEEFQETEDVAYLILEYVPGQTLAERIAKRPLKLEDTLSIALQIAEAVAAAHEHDVIHRDLKPGNIKITPEGKVKVLDFGLAKAVGGEAADQQSTVTEPGRVIGTPAYMSPEQARGKLADKRSDIWSFGCMLYEMLTAKIPFKGETISDTLANILQTDPDWQALPESTPANIQVLLRRCLEKDQHRRLRDIGDAAIEINETLTGTASSGTLAEVAIGSTRRARWRFGIRWLLVGLLVVIAVVLITITIKNLVSPAPLSKPAREVVRRFPVILPSSQQLAIDIWASNVALAPDGTSLVYVAGERGQNRLYLYNMIDAFAPKPIDGTEGAHNPFFSADGDSIAFFAEGKLKKVSLRSGTVLDICTVDVGSRGGCWGPDDTILFTMNPGTGLYRVSADGDICESVTAPDSTKGEISHRFPQVLPGGEAILFTIATEDSSDEWRIAVLSLGTGAWRDLNVRGSNPYYVQTGHLVYAGAAGRLLAAPFDLDRLVVTGSANKVIENVVTHPAAHFCVSANGTLVYAPSDVEKAKKKTLVWVDPEGPEEKPLGLPAAEYDSLRLSPDGQWLAVQIGTAASDCDVHVCEMERLVLTRLTFTPSWDVRPRWAPVSNRVTYSSSRDIAPPKLYWVLPDGSGEERLWEGDPNAPHLPSSWSSDERYLVFVEASQKTQFDIWVLSMEDGRQAHKFLGEPYNEKKPAFHPGGNWLAYVSDETGRFEVYVRRFPGGREKTRVSTDGGNDPMWDPSGQALYYRSGDKMMAVAIETEPSFSAGQPKELFRGRYKMNEWGTSYDVAITPDGLSFIMIKLSQEESAVMQLNVILNWFEELKRLVPPGND